MTEEQITIYVNGINDVPGSIHSWNGHAVTRTHLQSGLGKAEKVEYLCGPLTRRFWQQDRADRVQLLLRAYHDWPVNLVGHSNGAAVSLLALQNFGWPKIKHLHLISGACEADFDKNGLNSALRMGQVEKLHVYVAGKDAALQKADSWYGRLLGYGVLGLRGPVNMHPDIADRVHIITEPDYGHSDWFLDANFDKTMTLLTQP